MFIQSQPDKPKRAAPVLAVLKQLRCRYADLNLALIDQALVSGTNFITGILLARFLGLEEYGRFTLVWMLILLVSAVQMSLVLQPMMSIGPKVPEPQLSTYFGAAVLQQALLCALFCALTLLAGAVSHFLFPHWHVDGLIVPTMAVVVSFQAQEFIRRYFFTQRQMVKAWVNDLISYGGQLIGLTAGFFILKPTTDSVFWIIASTSSIAAVAGFLQMDTLHFNKSRCREIAVQHWHFAKWLVAGSCMQWISGQFFVMVSAALLSTAAVGALAAARNILGLTLILFSAIDNFVSVRASTAFRHGGWAALKSYILKVSLYGGLANSAICLIAAIFAPFWMRVLFGAAYVEYAYLIYWFSGTHFLMFFIRPIFSLLRTVENTRPIAIASVLPMILSLTTSVPLVKHWGLTGAMLVMFSTQVLILAYLGVSTRAREGKHGI